MNTFYSAREDNTYSKVPAQATNAHQRMTSGHEFVYSVNVPMQPVPLSDANPNLLSSYHSSGNNSINEGVHQSSYQSYTSSPPLPYGPPLPPQPQLLVNKSSASLSSSLTNVIIPLSTTTTTTTNTTTANNVTSVHSHTLSSSS